MHIRTQARTHVWNAVCFSTQATHARASSVRESHYNTRVVAYLLDLTRACNKMFDSRARVGRFCCDHTRARVQFLPPPPPPPLFVSGLKRTAPPPLFENLVSVLPYDACYFKVTYSPNSPPLFLKAAYDASICTSATITSISTRSSCSKRHRRLCP